MSSRIPVLFATAALLLAGAFGAVTSPPSATAGDVVVEGSIDVSVFYGALEPHGAWVEVAPYGWTWMPENVPYGWRPYTVGSWAWVEPYGWTWVSDEPWGWATYHYGRWTYADDFGWVWVPGTAWSPAWVAFRHGDPWVGWAPLPPGPAWRFDAGFDVGGLNLEVGIGTFAWTFVALQYFTTPHVGQRAYVSAYNPYFVERTAWSTRYAAVDGGIANLGVELATVERFQGAPVVRRRLREAAVLDKRGGHVDGDAVVVYRPRIAVKAPAIAPPAPRRHAPDGAATAPGVDSWAAQRKAALKAHVEAQRKALEEQDVTPPPTPRAKPDGKPEPGVDRGDAAKRRAAALKALEGEQKRLEALLERQRARREKELKQKPPEKAPPAAMEDAQPGMGGDHGGMDDDDHGMK